MVTVDIHIAVFPFPSSTVKFTVLGPISAHINIEKSILSEGGPQLSELPLSTSAGVMVAIPKASSDTVISWQRAIGEILSCTTTLAMQISEFSSSSVTVKLTILIPISAQVKSMTSRLRFTTQLSVLPSSTKITSIFSLG